MYFLVLKGLVELLKKLSYTEQVMLSRRTHFLCHQHLLH